MDRLTGWDVDYSKIGVVENMRTAILSAAMCRLAAYEDTGLTPEDVPSALEMSKIYVALQKLKAYEKAEAEGRLIVLPCKVGDTVYLPNKWMNVVVKFRIEAIQIYQDNVMLIDDCLGEYEVSDFGKTVFLTPEAAEAALKEA